MLAAELGREGSRKQADAAAEAAMAEGGARLNRNSGAEEDTGPRYGVSGPLADWVCNPRARK